MYFLSVYSFHVFREKKTRNPRKIHASEKYIITNTKVADFRAIQAPLSLRETANQAVISQEVADGLNIAEGDWIRLISN